jgi:predicted transposase YbfD/YdcC
MIRRLLQALDAQLLTTAITVWLAGRAETSASRQAIAVDGKTLRGSRTGDSTARHVLAACDQNAGIVLASTDVDGKTNEITRFGPLLDQIGDLRDTVITADAMHCQREHVDYLAERGAHWILTVKGNQPHLHKQLSRLSWRQVPQAARQDDRGHGRREIRTLKILTVAVMRLCGNPQVCSVKVRDCQLFTVPLPAAEPDGGVEFLSSARIAVMADRNNRSPESSEMTATFVGVESVSSGREIETEGAGG